MRYLIAAALGAPLLMTPVARAEPCCGPITADGQRLAAFLDRSGVDHLWEAGWHVDWQTGRRDRPHPGGKDAATHCSAFVAAMAQRLGVNVLRPPAHQQELLANAQLAWLRAKGLAQGWRALPSHMDAQRAANRGVLVLAAFQNPDPHRPGHIAIVRPSEKSRAALNQEGPQETQAGETNTVSTTVADGFAHHKGAWAPDGRGAMRWYAHDVDWSRIP
ncbi:MAG: hypothetical protein AB7F35_07525 [Acetobacteraceae bacterium]